MTLSQYLSSVALGIVIGATGTALADDYMWKHRGLPGLPTNVVRLTTTSIGTFDVKTTGCLNGNKMWPPRKDGFCYLADEPK